MAGRVTIQDIADALGVSRNTVSKAINNTGILADSTRERILQKAVEMGYKQFSYLSLAGKQQEPASPQAVITAPLSAPESSSPAKPGGTIALFSTMLLGASHFSSTMLDKVQNELSTLGYGLVMHRVTQENLNSMTLPNSFHKEAADAIICFEMFNAAYSDMICELDMPVLFVDFPVHTDRGPLKADRLLMDNRSNIYAFVNEMVRRGKKKIGFIGDHLHCTSFFERYMALREVLVMLNLPFSDRYCILGQPCENPSYEDYRAYILKQLDAMKELPDVFICANDFVAVDTLQALRKLGVSVPGDVYLCGFDDSPESHIVTPPLTTIHIHSQIMGFSAVHLLISRIRNPELNYRTIYTETSLIYRESTGD